MMLRRNVCFNLKICRFFSEGSSNTAAETEQFKSFMFVQGSSAEFVMEPDLEALHARLQRSDMLLHSLRARNLLSHIPDLELYVADLARAILQFRSSIQELQEEAEELQLVMDSSKLAGMKEEDLKSDLQVKNDLLERVQSLKSGKLRQKVVQALRLPNFLLDADQLVQVLGLRKQPEVGKTVTPASDHMKILSDNDWIYKGDFLQNMGIVAGIPVGVHLTGPAAALRWSLEEFFRQQFFNDNFRELCLPNVAKTAVLEACGVLPDVNNPQSLDALQVTQSAHGGSGVHLVGQRLPAFMALFSSRTLSHNLALPTTCFSVGTAYSGRRLVAQATNPITSLRDLGQYPICSFFAAGSSVSSMIEFCRLRVFVALREIAARLNISIRFVPVEPSGLNSAEMARIDVELWFPGCQKWCHTGYIQVLGSYVSERVRLMYSVHDGVLPPVDVVIEPLSTRILPIHAPSSQSKRSLSHSASTLLAATQPMLAPAQTVFCNKNGRNKYYAECVYGEININQVLACLIETYWSTSDVNRLPECLKELMLFEM